MKQSQASIKRSIKNLRMIIDSKTVDPTTKRTAYFAETTLRWAIEDTVDWQRPEVDLEDEVALLLKEVAEQSVYPTASGESGDEHLAEYNQIREQAGLPKLGGG